MKNKIFGGIAVLAVAAVAAWNVNINSEKGDLSAVSLANVEALAQEPGDGRYACYSNLNDYDRPCNLYDSGYYCPCGW